MVPGADNKTVIGPVRVLGINPIFFCSKGLSVDNLSTDR
jgi:hypothetical protein